MRLFVLIILVSFSVFVHAQELNCNFSLNHSQIQGTNKQVFETLEGAIDNFMNNRIWTNHVFESNERIECNILLTIYEWENNLFKGNLQVQSRRPVYNSSYNTVLFNFVDEDVEFQYIEYDPLEYSDNTFLNNLTSILAFYAYYIIALDYDSFSPKGGEPYYKMAEKLVQNANNAGPIGWRGSDSRLRKNRYWLVTNMLDVDYNTLREFNYNYHRLGLDMLESDVNTGKIAILDALQSVKKLYDSKPDPFMHNITILVESKSDEIVQMFKDANPNEKKEVYEIMKTLDPSSLDKYGPIKPN